MPVNNGDPILKKTRLDLCKKLYISLGGCWIKFVYILLHVVPILSY